VLPLLPQIVEVVAVVVVAAAVVEADLLVGPVVVAL
jgi:hypothetical protein